MGEFEFDIIFGGGTSNLRISCHGGATVAELCEIVQKEAGLATCKLIFPGKPVNLTATISSIKGLREGHVQKLKAIGTAAKSIQSFAATDAVGTSTTTRVRSCAFSLSPLTFIFKNDRCRWRLALHTTKSFAHNKLPCDRTIMEGRMPN
jgi:hypothetical protein